jgi:iron complex transport system substrate-binding protein
MTSGLAVPPGRAPRAKSSVRCLAGIFAIAAALCPLSFDSAVADQARPPPERVVSINLCADQYLAVLARRDQIAALSPSAHDAALSFFAEQLKGLPVIRDDAESVLKLNPDLVLASAFNKPQTLALLRAQGLNVVVIPPVRELRDIAAATRRLARIFGREEAGDALARELENLLRRTKQIAGAGERITALYYQNGGYASGPASYIGMMLSHLGLKNLAGMERQTIAVLALESVVARPPDVLIVSDQALKSDNQGAVLLNHPALEKVLKGKPRIVIPMRETICPGPVLLAALNRLSGQIRKAVQPARATE